MVPTSSLGIPALPFTVPHTLPPTVGLHHYAGLHCRSSLTLDGGIERTMAW
jgi:hypothetical protein